MSEPKVIPPTVGRVVLYRTGKPDQSQPFAAFVTAVRNDRLVDLTIFPPMESPRQSSAVQLLQPGDEKPPSEACYCEWMPYQIGQAAKTEELAKKLAG